VGNTTCRENVSLAVAKEAGEGFSSILGVLKSCVDLLLLFTNHSGSHTPSLLSPTHTNLLSEEALRDLEDWIICFA